MESAYGTFPVSKSVNHMENQEQFQSFPPQGMQFPPQFQDQNEFNPFLQQGGSKRMNTFPSFQGGPPQFQGMPPHFQGMPPQFQGGFPPQMQMGGSVAGGAGQPFGQQPFYGNQNGQANRSVANQQYN